MSWAFTFADQPWFNGLRALTTNEVALPVFNTFELFARLGRKRVAVDAPSMIPVDAIIADSVRGEPDLGAVASVDDARSRLTILAWNYHDVAGGYEDRRDVQLTLVGLPALQPSRRAPSNIRSTKYPATRTRRGSPWARRSHRTRSRSQSCERPRECARSRVSWAELPPATRRSTSPCPANP